MPFPPTPTRARDPGAARVNLASLGATTLLVLCGLAGCGRVGVELLPTDRGGASPDVGVVDTVASEACEPDCDSPPPCSGADCGLSCARGSADCDGRPENGCEVELLSSSAHCGDCGLRCVNPHGGVSCSAGSCAPQCDAGFASCDADPSNGCETALTTPDHCGACGTVCPAGIGEVALCSAGTCSTRCALGGSFALRMLVPASWPGTGLLSSGSGNFTLWALLRVTQSGNGLSGTVIPCGELVPDFRSISLINERYGVTYPNALFDRALLPGAAAVATLSGSAPRATLTLSRTAFVTGARLADPVNDPWPSAAAIMSLDSDADGKPGLSAPYKTGSGYASPPADTLGSTRAQTGYLATRLLFSLSGQLDSCTASSGTASVQRIDVHTLGCRVTGNSRDCDSSESDHLDQNAPAFGANPGTYALAKVDAAATCALVRTTLP